MREKIVAGNWKMNLLADQASQLVNDIIQEKIANIKLIIFPPAVFVQGLAKQIQDTNIGLGVQNCSNINSGAYTGEISAAMVKSAGANYAIIGHSERREYFNETNHLLAEKIDICLANNITPIYCCGERLSERESNNHFDIIKSQIEEGLFHLSNEQIKKIIIAYEPVWAIGTGKTASSEQAQEIHLYIRNIIANKYTNDTAQNISILYGGSCKPNNAKKLFSQPDIDGGLIGGASLNAPDFIAIANSF